MIQKAKVGRRVIGRSLSNLDDVTPAEQSQIFTLHSGQKAKFKKVHIKADELADKTYVDINTNGREQNGLTKEALSDIARSLRLQQFFPAIGRKIADKIELLDGSRRRACAINENIGLDVLVTEDELSMADAQQLAKDIQTAKEHNIREIGIRLLALRDTGMNQKEIALANNLSASKVTRAIQAASVPEEMLVIFPVRDELNTPDYKILLDIHTQFEQKKYGLSRLIRKVEKAIAELNTDLSSEDTKVQIIKLYRHFANEILANRPKTEKAKLTKLWQFDDPNVFARKRIKDRAVNYEFNRVPISVQSKIEDYIKQVLAEHYGR